MSTGLCGNPIEHKREVVNTLMHTMVSDERDKVEKKSHENMNGYPDWLINSKPKIQPSLESTTSVSGDDTSDDETHQ